MTGSVLSLLIPCLVLAGALMPATGAPGSSAEPGNRAQNRIKSRAGAGISGQGFIEDDYYEVEEYTGKGLIGKYQLEVRAHALPFRISGTVREQGVPLRGVTLTTGDESAVTRRDGTYQIEDVEAGWYTVRPSLPGYRFTPESQRVRVGLDAAGIDFEAHRLFRISGRILAGGKPLAGARVSAGTVSVLSGATGQYQLSGLEAGSYSLTVQKIGYAFEPGAQNVTVGPDQEEVNFTGRIDAALTQLTLSPATVSGGKPATATVAFSRPLPIGTTVVITSSNPRVAKPVRRRVRLLAGVSSASFRIRTRRVAAAVPVTISASLGETSLSTELIVQP